MWYLFYVSGGVGGGGERGGGPQAAAQSVIRAIPVFNEEPVC